MEKHRKHHRGHSHGEGFSIDYYAYLSGIGHWNAGFKVGFALLVLILCVALDSIWVSLFVVITMGALTVGMGKIPLRQYLSLLTIPIAFMIMGSVAIAFDFSSKPAGMYCLDLRWFYIYTSNAQILQAGSVILKAFGAVSALYMMTLSTPAHEIILVLRKMHVPKLIVELMNMIYRFIFILVEVQRKMKISAQSRLGYATYGRALYSFGNIAGNLFLVSLKKANAYYDALESRCYTGELLFLEQEKPWQMKQVIGALCYTAGMIALWAASR